MVFSRYSKNSVEQSVQESRRWSQSSQQGPELGEPCAPCWGTGVFWEQWWVLHGDYNGPCCVTGWVGRRWWLGLRSPKCRSWDKDLGGSDLLWMCAQEALGGSGEVSEKRGQRQGRVQYRANGAPSSRPLRDTVLIPGFFYCGWGSWVFTQRLPPSLVEGCSWGIHSLAFPVCAPRAEHTLSQRAPSDRDMRWLRQEVRYRDCRWNFKWHLGWTEGILTGHQLGVSWEETDKWRTRSRVTKKDKIKAWTRAVIAEMEGRGLSILPSRACSSPKADNGPSESLRWQHGDSSAWEGRWHLPIYIHSRLLLVLFFPSSSTLCLPVS